MSEYFAKVAGVWLTSKQYSAYWRLTHSTIAIGGTHVAYDVAYTMAINGMYLVTYSKIYEMRYDEKKARVHGRVIYTDCRRRGEVGITLRGRYFAYDKEDVVHLLGNMAQWSPHKKEDVEKCLRYLSNNNA